MRKKFLLMIFVLSLFTSMGGGWLHAQTKNGVAKIGETPYNSLSEAFAAVTDDAQTVVILQDVTENLTASLRGNITTENGAKVTITLTNSDWVYCPYTFVVGENITLNIPAFFYYAGGTQINGTVVAGAYYQMYQGTKLTINEPGSMTVTSETFILRYTDDANAGIYINGDNNDETIGLNLAVAYFYQGMINAKDANIKAGTYWQTNETDGQGSANLVLDNSKLVVSVYDHPAKATGNSTVTLTNGSVIDAKNGGFTYGDATVLRVDATSHIIGKGGEVVKLPVAKIGTTNYNSFADALNAAKSMTGDVTVEIYEKVTMNQALAGSYNSIKFVGKDTDAEIYLDVQGYTTATGKKVAFENLILSKSEGGFIANAGFMNVAFGIFDVAEVSYTNCTFLNGAYASSGKVTYTGCTFKKSWDKYGLWAYGNVDITVDGCTFADYRGIKMYAENGANASVEKPNLVVKNTDFSAVDNKPAIVLTYGESVQLAGNTYSTTGVFELDLDGKPNGVAVTSDVAPTCINDNGACGVLVDGKIYTTVAQAAEVATSGSTVKLLHDSTETVEFPMGVTLEKNGFEAIGVTVVVPVAQIGTTPYTTLEAAFKAATSGCTIDILSDVTVDSKWDCRYTGSKFTVPVTINGNGKTIKFTASVNDNNWNTIFRFEENATVNNLTVDIANATGAQRVISAKKSLNVDGLNIVGAARYGVIYGEGASKTDLAATEIVVKNSTLNGTRRAISDNEGGKDVKSVVITGNTLKANAYISASESIVFNNNTANGEVDLRSYTAENVLSVEAKENTLKEGVKNYIYAKNIDAQEEFTTENPPLKVSNKAELDAALEAAKEGNTITLTADIDYGTTQLAITKAITLDLGGKTLTTRNAWGGMSIKGNPTVKNGNIVHASNTAAIKVWNATAFEDLVIDVQGKGDANKTIGGIVLQNVSTTKVGSIKNVTIKGAALTNGIETYNCGDADATENVIGSMENVTIDAQGTGMLISAPCGTATNCSISGGTNGIEIWIKGNYSASLDLVASKVEGGVYAHDEFINKPDAVNNGKLSLTADEATTGAGLEDVTLTIARAEAENVKGVLKDVMEAAQAKIGDTYYTTIEKAFKAAQAGQTVTILKAGTYALKVKNNVTITGAVNGVEFANIGAFGCNGANVTFNNVTFTYANTSTYKGLQHSGSLVYNNCTFNGQVFLYGASETFNNCKFSNTGDNYNVWTYGAKEVAFNGCTFNCDGKSVLIYTEGKDTFNNVTVTECIFNASKAVEGKAAIEMDSSLSKGINLTIDGETTATGFGTGNVSGNSLWNNKKANNDITVVVNNETVLAPINGDGTEDNPYLINNVRELVAFRESVNAGKTEFNAPGVYVALNADIDLDNEEWTVGIGDGHNYSFDGNFDGKNYTIKNLNIKPYADADNYICGGLFGYTFGSVTIKNLVIENAKVNFATAEAGKEYHNVGVLVGFANNKDGKLNIDNVIVKGDIKVDAPQTYGVGAIVGYSYREMGTITNTKVIANDGSYINGQRYVGGITGYSYDNAVITKCIVNNLALTGEIGVGGIAGLAKNGNNIAECTVTNVTVNGDKNVAYIVGELQGEGGSVIIADNNNAPQPWVGGSWGSGEPFVATIGTKYYTSIKDAIKAVKDNETIVLIRDITMDYNARDSYETQTQNIVIDGNDHTLTLNQKNSDWASIGLANNSKLVLNNMTIEKTGYGDTNGAWNTHAIIFSCPLEMNDVIVNNAIAVQAGATLNRVTINEAGEYYGLWINGNGQTVTVNGGAINATNKGRGIKIADQYIDAPAKVTLNVTDTDFNTAKKAAVLVSSKAGAQIVASNVNIEHVTADKVNFVWVDEDWAANFGEVTVTGGTVAQESIEEFFAANTKDAKVEGYYKTLQAAVNAAQDGETVSLLKDIAENVTVSQNNGINIVIDGQNHNFSGTITIDGNSRTTGESLTIQNVNFVTNVASLYFIDANSTDGADRYPHNVTVKDCTFTAEENSAAVNTAVAMRLRQGFNITVENVTAVRLHSLMQNYGVAGVTVNNVEVDGKNGIAFGTSTNVTVTDATIKAEGYGLRVDASVTTPITIADSEIEAFIPVVVREASANPEITFEGVNTMTATNADGYWCVIGATEYKVDGNLPELGTGNVFVSLNDEGLSYEGIYGHYAVAQIGDVKYATLQAAIDAANDGETITVVREIALTEGLTVAAGKVVTLDLNGKTVTGTPEVAAAFAVITNMGDLTITNGTIICDHKLAGSTSYAVNTIVNSGKLTIDGATVENISTASNQIGYAIDNNSTSYNSIVVIKAGKVTASGSNYYDGIRMFCNNTTAENNVIIEGGEVSSLWMQNPSDGAAGRNTKDVKGSFEIKGGSLNALYLEPSAAFAGSISAGYVGSVSAFETADGRDLIAFITGGTFGTDVTAFLAPGYSCEQNADGIYTVKFAYVEIDYTTYSLIFSITDFDAKEASVKIGSKAPSSGVKLVTPTEVQINGETYSVTSLAKNAFSGTNFASIEISEGVTTIGDYALANMYKLTDVIFPSTLKTVGNRCFYGYGPTANSLKTITSYATEVPAAEAASFQTAVGQNATLYVYGNYNDYKKAEGWKKFTNIIGKVIVEKEGYSLLVKVSDNNCSVQINDRPAQAAKLQLEIPSTIEYFGTTREITSIANNGFKSCSFYGTITVPGTIKTVGNSAFNTCTQVSKVVFEEGVETIGTRALATMGNLTTVVFPSTLKTLADECFYGYHAENHKVTTIVSYATEAPTAVAGTFQQGICNKATLYVFEDAIASYKAAAGWKKFVNVKAIEAQIGETYYLTLASAIKAAQASDVIELIANVEAADATPIVIPTDVTLNINTHNIKANIYGTVKTEGGVWTTVAVPGFASRDMLGEGAIYSTTDATVANLENEIEVVAGTIVLNPNPEKEWWTLPGQSLSIAEDATFKVPANVKFTVRENTHVVAAGTIVTEGVVYLQAGATVEAAEGLNIQTEVEDHVVEYTDGIYSVVRAIFTQTIQLNAGWNWFSSYVETDLESLQAALGENGLVIKSDVDGFNEYLEGWGWDGTLQPLSPSQMYMIETSAPHSLVLSGELLKDVEITLYQGWNWISFPMNTNISVADAFARLTATDGDVIKSNESGFAEYLEGWGWDGTLSLAPGQGYMYYSNSETPVTFTYSPSMSKSEAKANVTTDGNYWIPNASQYANNMTMTAVLDVENINYEVAAFVNGECRGSARPIYVEPLDAYMLFLTIHGEEVEEMTFKYYDIDTDTEYTLSDRINYSNNAILGSLKEPYMFTRGTTGIGEAELSQLNIYPNPTTTAAEINLNATFDKVEVFNALGVKVAEYSNVDSIDALETAGIYVIRATNNSVISHCRLVVK